MAEYVRIEARDGFTEVVLDRPDRRNALIQPLGAELRDSIRGLSGRKLFGPDLVSMGIALRSVAEGQVLESARELCAELGVHPPAGLLNSKAIMRGAWPRERRRRMDTTAATSMPYVRPSGPLPPVR